jgi:hypothetical protein
VTFDRVVFAATRRKAQEDLIATLEPVVAKALEAKQAGSETWWRSIVDAAHPLFDKILTDDGGNAHRARVYWAHLALDLAHSLTKTDKIRDYTDTLIATWVASNILSYATEAAAAQSDEPYLLEWITMHDSKVRHTHKDADGQKVRPGRPFKVGTTSMRRPGDVTAPIGEWINCRCTVAAVPLHDNQAASVDTDPRRTQGVTMNNMIQRATPTLYGESLVAAVEAAPEGSLVPWYGVLTVEGKWSGDRRKFKEGSLSHRDLPLPLTWQKVSADGHDNNVTVASIDWLEKRNDTMWAAGGQILPITEADEMVGLLAHFGKFGVSIDADMAEMSFVEYDGGSGEPSDMDEMPGQEFSAGRICGACVLNIPAFQEAFVTLGEDPDHDYGDAALAASIAELTLDDPESLDVTDPGFEALLRALRGDSLNAEMRAAIDEHLEVLGRGPGWITNPADTKRIHDYWTKPGEPGYAKIGWGTPGDFNRCRVEVGSEIAEDSPEKTRFLNQICAQWHKDATGFWPGHAPTEGGSLEKPEGEMGPAVALVASVDTAVAPAEWFTDPHLTKPTPIQITEDGHIFGHVADWTTCHMGFNAPGQCVQITPSTNGYAYYRVGEVMTTEGPVPTGPVTLATGHAGGRLGMRPALAHYDNTGTAVADVAAGDDEHGVWINGWVRPWISEEKKYELRAHPPSGDWRRNPNTGGYDMIAVLSVNAPGLPITRYGVENGVQMSIIASLGAEEEESADVVADIAAALADELERRASERAQIEALTLEDA